MSSEDRSEEQGKRPSEQRSYCTDPKPAVMQESARTPIASISTTEDNLISEDDNGRKARYAQNLRERQRLTEEVEKARQELRRTLRRKQRQQEELADRRVQEEIIKLSLEMESLEAEMAKANTSLEEAAKHASRPNDNVSTEGRVKDRIEPNALTALPHGIHVEGTLDADITTLIAESAAMNPVKVRQESPLKLTIDTTECPPLTDNQTSGPEDILRTSDEVPGAIPTGKVGRPQNKPVEIHLCEKCEATFTTESCLLFHARTHENPHLTPTIRSELRGKPPITVGPNYKDRQSRIDSSRGPPYLCGICGLSFFWPQDLDIHVERTGHCPESKAKQSSTQSPSTSSGDSSKGLPRQSTLLTPCNTPSISKTSISEGTLSKRIDSPLGSFSIEPPPSRTCWFCAEVFASKDRLFDHIKSRNHAAPPPGVKETFTSRSEANKGPAASHEMPRSKIWDPLRTCRERRLEFSAADDMLEHMRQMGHFTSGKRPRSTHQEDDRGYSIQGRAVRGNY
ncbi:hypothetical protein MMC25_000642 [Agyrium rufum]|nr:hypothetical protein [Agyrium rufum]